MQRTVIERRLVEPGNPAAGEVILSGIQREDSVAWTEIRLTFENGAPQELPVPEDAGYQPRLWIGSLTGAGKRDILLSIDSGGSGAIGYYTVYADQGDGYALVFCSDAYQPRYVITYENGRRVRADSLENGRTYLIDLSDLDRTYLDALYDANGRLKAPRSGDVNPLSALLPIDPDGDGVYDLLGFQRITGLYNADGLGDFMNQLSWRTGAFALVNQWVGIFGARI